MRLGEGTVDNRAPSGFTGDVRLRDVTEGDLAILFEQQLDPQANYMAAFTSRDPTDRDAFMAHWARLLGDEAIIKRTILADGQVAGSIVSFPHRGRREVGYWLGKHYWGRGIATSALAAFLRQVQERPLYAGAAKDNTASLRVLQKCGFTIRGEDKGFSRARGAEVEEYTLILQANARATDET
jgi:RimJ/RimL family protein N-acetyltransferase